jgi:hypothetical protein
MSSLTFKVTGDPAFSMFNLSLREEWLNNKKFCHRLSDDEVSVFLSFLPLYPVVDPDWIWTQYGRWIRIWIRYPDPVPGGKC